MADPKKDITTLRDSSSIKKAQLASSPYVLRKIFAVDPIIQRVIAAGKEVIPIIAEETSKSKHLDEITLSAFAFIIENVNAKTAPEVLGSLFLKSLEKPGPFFVHFAAHAIRSAFQLPIKPLEVVYSRAELIETQDLLR